MSDAMQDVLTERDTQTKEWPSQHDDRHSLAEWVALLTRHVGLAVDDGACVDIVSSRFRKQMVRVAALAIAAVEAFDRNQAKTAGLPVENRGPGY